MDLQRQVLFWLGALVVFIFVTWVLLDVLLPFVAGMALAYLLNPVADRLERAGMNRMVATLLISAAFVLVFVLAMVVLVPILGSQIFAFIQRLPGYVLRLQELLAQESQTWLRDLIGEYVGDIRKSIGDLVGQDATWVGAFLQSLWSGGRALVSVFALAIVTPVVTFYLLNDWPRMVERIDSWLPLRHRDTIRELARQIDEAVAGFVRGQALVCLILAVFYSVALSLVGLNFALLIGAGAGIVSFIPYVGSLAGLVIATGVAVAEFWPNGYWIALVVAIFLVGQFAEGYILSPKLVGERVGLHPVCLMFALFAFGYLFGFVGLLLSVPLAAAAGVLARFALKRYLESPLYSGGKQPRSKSGRR